MSKVRQKAERVGATPLRNGKEFHGGRGARKAREFFREEVRAELRGVPALNNWELITALLSSTRQLALVGLQLRIINGVVSLHYYGGPQQGFGRTLQGL